MSNLLEKEILCQTSLEDFAVESVGGVPFMRRYGEFRNLMKRKLPRIDFEQTFAEPVENGTRKVVEWHYLPGSESPERLSDIKNSNESLYNEYCSKRDKIVGEIRKVAAEASGNEKDFFDILNLDNEYSDTFTYGYDGKVLFGIWGMVMKKGRQISSVITDGTEDQRTYTISYHIEGEGTLAPFTKIHRRHGHVLQGDNDIPQVTAADGYEFKEWTPEPPYGKAVTSNKDYIAVFQAVESHEEQEGMVDKPDEEVIDSENDSGKGDIIDDDQQSHTVTFTADDHLKLHGDTRYEKRHNEQIIKDEIPGIETDPGYEFVEWDKNPENHTVTEDVNFHARCRKIEKEKVVTDEVERFAFWPFLHGLLKWLLFLLLLALIALFLWYLFGNHNLNFCGCNCDEDTVIVDPDPNKKDPFKDVIPQEYDCNSTVKSGRDEGFLGYIDMHQDSGTFQFHYNTQVHRDSIVIYDGKGMNGRILFQYGGGTGDGVWCDANVAFFNRFITVKVRAIDSGTVWNFRVDCPDEQNDI